MSGQAAGNEERGGTLVDAQEKGSEQVRHVPSPPRGREAKLIPESTAG